VSDPRAALDAIGQLPDQELDLAGAALQLARIDQPDADWHAAREHLSELARDAVALAADRQEDDPSVRAGALAGLLTGRHRYLGDTEDYDAPANANLIQVIERRRGLPVALGILWLHCARAAGWEAHGVDFPGHFLIALAGGGTQLVLDVFAGGLPLDARAMRTLIKRYEGPKAELRPGLLRPASARDVLLRLQQNIRQRRLDAGNVTGALTCVEDMLRIAPDAALLWRDAALINQRLDHVAAALRCFERFLALVPQGEAAERVRTAMGELRTRLN
jgi:regulator of sirC expression with transglutaminase-like and TPR domain